MAEIDKNGAAAGVSGKRLDDAPLRKRFYEAVAVGASADGHRVLLDGRPIRTPAKKAAVVPSAGLAERLAEEWQAQQTVIDPASMPMTRLVNTAIDGIAGQEHAVRDDVAKYAGSDLLCYRAGHPQELADRQAKCWDPVLAWFAELHEARFVTIQGVMPVKQSEAVLAAFRSTLDREGALSLAALHVVTTMTGSAVLAMALRQGYANSAQIWDLAHVDEDWQISHWGEDFEASERRDKRWREFSAAAELLSLIGPE